MAPPRPIASPVADQVLPDQPGKPDKAALVRFADELQARVGFCPVAGRRRRGEDGEDEEDEEHEEDEEDEVDEEEQAKAGWGEAQLEGEGRQLEEMLAWVGLGEVSLGGSPRVANAATAANG